MNQISENARLERNEVLEIFQKLPKEDRLRAEGIALGMLLAREQPDAREGA